MRPVLWQILSQMTPEQHAEIDRQLATLKGQAVMKDLTDLTPRYAPRHVIIAARMKQFPVTGWRIYPAGQHPASLPKVIKPEYTVLECQTEAGSRYFGVRSGYINSELRMVIIGTNPRDEVQMKWPIVPEDKR
jgi:hypothetical protein